MAHEPTTAIPTGGDEPLQNLETIPAGGELPNTGPNPEASSALDAALLEATQGEGTEGLELDEAAVKAQEEAKAKAEADAKAAEEAKAKADAEAAAKAANEPPAAPAPVKDKFDEVTLPRNASPKSGEAFETVKSVARAAVAEANKQRDELKAAHDALVEKAAKAGELSPEMAKELEELRAFRAKLDVEADPQFKEWDTKVSENVELIYTKVKAANIASGATEAVTKDLIEKIKNMGGPSEVDWDKLVETGTLSSSVKRYIEGKLFENEDLTERKKKALDAAKLNAAEYVKSKAESSTKEVTDRRAGVEKKVAELSPNIEWLNVKKATAGAKPEEIAAVEAHNKRAADIKSTMREAIENDSPEMKGLLILGIAQLQRVNGEFEAFKVSAAAEKAKLEADLKEITDRLNKVKRSSPGRISSGAPAPGEVTKTVKVDYNEDGGSALDRQLKEAQAADAARE